MNQNHKENNQTDVTENSQIQRLEIVYYMQMCMKTTTNNKKDRNVDIADKLGILYGRERKHCIIMIDMDMMEPPYNQEYYCLTGQMTPVMFNRTSSVTFDRKTHAVLCWKEQNTFRSCLALYEMEFE